MRIQQIKANKKGLDYVIHHHKRIYLQDVFLFERSLFIGDVEFQGYAVREGKCYLVGVNNEQNTAVVTYEPREKVM